MRKAAGVLLILIGLVIISYPKLKEVYFEYRQKQLMEAMIQSWTVLDKSEDLEQETEDNSKGEDSDYLAQYVKNHTEGILKIEKIDLQMPILKGATETNLNISAASIDGTGKPGQAGNYCISAHRSRFYGMQFNRLNELSVGDSVDIIVKDISYKYEVFEKLLVKAEDTWVLLPQDNQKLLTLITCDYRHKLYPRLVVRASLVEN